MGKVMDVALNLYAILKKIREYETRYKRKANSVALLAVSKGQSLEKIKEAYNAGQRLFGENYLQEALEKQEKLLNVDIEWHYIGKIQSNKTKMIAEKFSWVHTVDRLKIAERLNAQRPQNLPPLNICIEVNLDEEASKSGVCPESLNEFAMELMQFDRLRLRGLMAIPKITYSMTEQRAAFMKLAGLQNNLIKQGLSLDTLSMGMSDDYEAAIACGSTIVRIGRALFGQRG